MLKCRALLPGLRNRGTKNAGFRRKRFIPFAKKTVLVLPAKHDEKFISVLVMCWKHSFTARSFRAVAGCKGFTQHSLVLRAVKCPVGYLKEFLIRVGKWLDKLVLRLSASLQKWSGASLLCNLFRFIFRASEERIFVLAAPIFGVGYIVGRLILNRLMIRDILFLSVTFFAAAVLLIKPEKLRAYFRGSLVYKLYLLVLG